MEIVKEEEEEEETELQNMRVGTYQNDSWFGNRRKAEYYNCNCFILFILWVLAELNTFFNFSKKTL